MQCASNIHVVIQYPHSSVFSSSRVWDLPTNVTNVPSLPSDVCCFLSIFAMQEFSTGVLHFPRFAVPGKQINCQCLDDMKPVKSHYWMSPLRWWWLMHLFYHLPVCLCRAHQCLPAPAPLPVRGVPGLYFLGDLDPGVVLSQILIEVPEKVQPGPECLICSVERVPFFQLLYSAKFAVP